MEFTIKDAGEGESQSKREREKELVEGHVDETGNIEKKDVVVDDDTIKVTIPTEKKEEITEPTGVLEVNENEKVLTDEEVFKYLNEKTGRTIASYEDLVETREIEKEIELTEDLAALKKYKEETGRTLLDYIEANKDYDSMSDEKVIELMYSDTLKGLDKDDVEFKINSEFGYDEDLDEESDIRQKKINKRLKAAEAREYLNKKKGEYNIPLESREQFVPDTERETYEAFKQHLNSKEEQKVKSTERSERFDKLTNELFSDKFKGFEFKVGDKEIVYNIEDMQSVKSMQSDVNNFINKHLDDNGMLKDAGAYHKALYAAMNTDALVKYAYELGASEAIAGSIKDSKNIDMSPLESSAPKANASGLRMAESDPSRGGGLKIKSTNKK